MKHPFKRFASLVLALALSMGVLCMDASAAGSNYQTATSVTWNKTYYGAITSTNHADYYTFTLASSGRITLTATMEGMDYTDYYIRDASGSVIWQKVGFGDSATKIGNVVIDLDLTKGTYYFIVKDSSFYLDQAGDYFFKITFESAGESFAETQNGTNNSLGQASVISLNRSYIGQLAINDSSDFYRFVMPSAGKLQVNVTSKLPGVGYYVYDGSGVQVWKKTSYSDSVTGLNSVSDTIELKRGTYYFVAASTSYYYTGPYTFKLSTSAAGTDASTKLATPSVPTLKTAPNGVIINWSKVNGAQKYRVFRKTGNGSWVKLGDTAGTSWIDRTALKGKTYTYTIRCVSSDGKTYTSDYNKTGKSILYYVATPRITKLQSASNGVIINWGKVDGAQKYRVFRKTAGGGWVRLGDASGTAWIDRTAQKGVTYTYTIRCVSSDGKTYTSSFNSSGWTVRR